MQWLLFFLVLLPLWSSPWDKEVPKDRMRWQDAMDYCEKKKYRLPNIQELVEAYDRDLPGFEYEYYWSSTSYIAQPLYAWYIFFDQGIITSGKKSDYSYVRCIQK